MSKKSQKHKTARHTTQPRDLERWLERAMKQLLAEDYAGALATLQRVADSPLASPQQRAEGWRNGWWRHGWRAPVLKTQPFYKVKKPCATSAQGFFISIMHFVDCVKRSYP